MRRRVLAISLIAVLLAAARAVWAADVPVSVVSLSSPAATSSDATLEIQTTPGASCTIAVLYKSGREGLGSEDGRWERPGDMAVASRVEHDARSVAPLT